MLLKEHVVTTSEDIIIVSVYLNYITNYQNPPHFNFSPFFLFPYSLVLKTEIYYCFLSEGTYLSVYYCLLLNPSCLKILTRILSADSGCMSSMPGELEEYTVLLENSVQIEITCQTYCQNWNRQGNSIWIPENTLRLLTLLKYYMS